MSHLIRIDLEKWKDVLLRRLKHYAHDLLAPTDYIITKIAEADALGQTHSLRELYTDQLQYRQRVRQWIEQTKLRIQQAQTIEELQNIEIKFVDD
jgi:hypothetical protein